MSRMVNLKEEYLSCIATVAVAVSMPGTCNAIQIVRPDILIYNKCIVSFDGQTNRAPKDSATLDNPTDPTSMCRRYEKN